MWIKASQQDMKSNNLSLYEAIDVAQNHSALRTPSAYGIRTDVLETVIVVYPASHYET